MNEIKEIKHEKKPLELVCGDIHYGGRNDFDFDTFWIEDISGSLIIGGLKNAKEIRNNLNTLIEEVEYRKLIYEY